jgi:signal transduction histidine kinase
VFDPAEAVAMAQLLVRPRAAEAGLILDVKPPADGAWLSADKLAIEQILVNLLANSVKFTPRGRIELSSGRTEDGFYCFTVCDTGIGMSSADIEVALTPFGMVGSPLNRRQSGTGLGLPIVASLAKLHGGELRVESEVGKGTAISILLPPERVVNGPASAPEPAYTTFP